MGRRKLAKKSDKKAKKAQKRMMEQQAAAWAGGGFPPPRQQGLFAGLSRMLPKGRAEQFLLGAAIGAAAAYVLSDEELRGKLLKSGMKLYTGLVGGLEEVKEQMADIQAEMAAEQDGLM
jgi:hypothetical protein